MLSPLDGDELSVGPGALLAVAVLLSVAVADEEVVVSAEPVSEPSAEGVELTVADAVEDVVLSELSTLSSPAFEADEDAVAEAVAVDVAESLFEGAVSPSEAVDVDVAVSDDVEDVDESGGSIDGMASSEMPAASARTSFRAAAAPLWLE